MNKKTMQMNKKAMFWELANQKTDDCVGVMITNPATEKKVCYLYVGDNPVNRAIQQNKPEEGKVVAFYSRLAARQTVIKDSMSHYKLLRNAGCGITETYASSLASVLSSWTGKPEENCLREIQEDRISYLAIK